MKTIEEKAKAYDDAIQRMKGYVIDEFGCTRLKPSDIFPELTESEDEKIRKELIQYIKNWKKAYCKDSVNVELLNGFIAWLEKQGEQKPEIRTTGYWNVQEIEQKPVEWSEEDEDRLRCAINACLRDYGKDSDTAEWLKSLKDRCLPRPKPEWSKEDETARNDIIAKLAILKSRAVDGGAEKEICEMEINWLQSLRPQKQWKPREEQIKVCKLVYADILSAKGFNIATVNDELQRLEEALLKAL